MLDDDEQDELIEKMKSFAVEARRKTIYFTPYMWYVVLLLHMSDNTDHMMEFHIIQDAGLLPKLKYVHPIMVEDEIEINSYNYIFDPSLTIDEFMKIAVIGIPTKFVSKIAEQVKLDIRDWYMRAKQQSPESFIVVLSNREFGTIPQKDIIKVRSVKDHLVNHWQLNDTLPSSEASIVSKEAH